MDTIAAVRRKKVKLEDVADAAEISISAASMALADHPRISEATKERVRSAARQLGYSRPRDQARHRLRGRTGSRPCRIGLLLIGGQLQDEVHLAMLNMLTAVTSANDLRLELSATPEIKDRDRIQRHALNFADGLDGILMTGPVDTTLLSRLESMDVPHTLIGHLNRAPSDPPAKIGQVVAYDEEAMGRLATARLLENGHRRIAFLCEIAPENMSHARWLNGYRLAHFDAGLVPDESFVNVSGQPYSGAEPGVNELMKLPKPPTAWVCPDMRIGDSLLSALRSRGIRLRRQDIILSGMQEIARQYRLDRYPLILPDSQRMIRIAVSHLMRLIDSRELRQEGPVEIQVPFEVHNLP